MSSMTSRSLQGVSPYTFPLRTAHHFLHGGGSADPTSPEIRVPYLGALDERDLGQSSAQLVSLSLPGIQFLVQQGFLIGDMHLNALGALRSIGEELESQEHESFILPLENYGEWHRVEPTVVRGSGVARPTIDSGDEEY